MKNKILELTNGNKRIVFDVPEDKVKEICRYCGLNFKECNCDRTEHVYDEKTGGCILCYESFKPNGTGPSNSPFIHWFINFISWFNRWVSRISDKHDVGYFEGFTESIKNILDMAMRKRTHDKIDRTWFLKPKSLWKKRADVNWLAVDKCGDSSFNWSGCVTEDSLNSNVTKSKQ